jgi:hypothetical protein
MADGWRTNAHAVDLPGRPSASQLVTSVFAIQPKPLAPGDVLRTQVGRFLVERINDAPPGCQVVLLTDMQGGEARLGVVSAAAPNGSSVVLYTSVHPRSWVARAYYRLIEPFHHLLMEQVVLRRLRRRATEHASRAFEP